VLREAITTLKQTACRCPTVGGGGGEGHRGGGGGGGVSFIKEAPHTILCKCGARRGLTHGKHKPEFIILSFFLGRERGGGGGGGFKKKSKKKKTLKHFFF